MSQPGFDFYRTSIPPEIIAIVPESVARQSSVVPVRVDANGLVVAVADLSDRERMEMLRFVLNRSVTAIFATREAIRFALEKYYPTD